MEKNELNVSDENMDPGIGKMNQLMEKLEICKNKIKCGNYEGLLEDIEQAVELGYYHGKAFVGNCYAAGLMGAEQNLEKGVKLLAEVYDEYTKNAYSVKDFSKDTLIQSFNNYATAYLWVHQDNGDVNEEVIKKVVEIFKAAIDVSFGLKSEENDVDKKQKESLECSDGELGLSAKMLLSIGKCFYNGKISSSDREDVIIPTDYHYAYKAFTQSYKLGCEDACEMILELDNREDSGTAFSIK